MPRSSRRFLSMNPCCAQAPAGTIRLAPRQHVGEGPRLAAGGQAQVYLDGESVFRVLAEAGAIGGRIDCS
jgi:hypothetical protein